MKGNERKLLVLGASAPMAAQSEAIIIVIIRRRGEEHKKIEKSKFFGEFVFDIFFQFFI